jgi:hypothetical protein
MMPRKRKVPKSEYKPVRIEVREPIELGAKSAIDLVVALQDFASRHSVPFRDIFFNLEVDGYGDYYDGITTSVYSYRSETPSEVAERIARLEERNERLHQADLAHFIEEKAQYERLKKKFG